MDVQKIKTSINNLSLEDSGKHLYQSNPMFKDIANFMEHPLYKDFYKKYLNQQNISVTLFFLWFYSEIEKKYSNLKPYETLGLLITMFRDSKIRPILFEKYYKTNKTKGYIMNNNLKIEN